MVVHVRDYHHLRLRKTLRAVRSHLTGSSINVYYYYYYYYCKSDGRRRTNIRLARNNTVVTRFVFTAS